MFSIVGACGGDDADAPSTAAGIGPEGGLVRFEELELEIPEGALDTKVVIDVERADGLTATTGRRMVTAFELSPSGLTFNVPATARVAYSGSGSAPLLFTSSNGTTWSQLGEAKYDSGKGIVQASIEHFSFLSLQVQGVDPGAGGTGGESGGPGPGGVDAGGNSAVVSMGGADSSSGGAAGAAGQLSQSGQSTGGAGGQGGEAGQPGSSSGVVCHDLEGGGGDECESGGLTCSPGQLGPDTEILWSSCDDGHTYEVYCSADGSSCECDCLIDGDPAGTCSYTMQDCTTDFEICTCDTFPELTWAPE